MDDAIRMTVPVARVLRVFLDDTTVPRYGFDLMDVTGLASGTLYPILVRLERAGWIVAAKEDIDPVAEGRPARKNFTLTGVGERSAREQLVALATEFAAPNGHTTRQGRLQGGLT
ncbi:MAG TPA: helix-turn-helix transcriptional regulator [Pseudonocardiaceae bacterium]|jgi:DNA-binding PadR family transcriptional regulator|nr:helix-turn-helix transcriptional regulator [Pseudonocardiaceae bacterium]